MAMVIKERKSIYEDRFQENGGTTYKVENHSHPLPLKLTMISCGQNQLIGKLKLKESLEVIMRLFPKDILTSGIIYLPVDFLEGRDYARRNNW